MYVSSTVYVALTIYPDIVIPGTDVGGVHLTVALASPAVAVTPVGTLGPSINIGKEEPIGPVVVAVDASTVNV